MPQPEGLGGLLLRIRRTLVLAVALVVVLASGLAFAFYWAGSHLALRDPSYQRAERLDLITAVNQSQQLGSQRIVVERVLFDTARTTVFYRVLPQLECPRLLEVKLQDNLGVSYDPYGGRGYAWRYFVAEVKPVDMKAEEVVLSFGHRDGEEQVSFKIPFSLKRLTIWPGTTIHQLQARLGRGELGGG